MLPIATVSKQLGQNEDMRLYASEAKEYFLAELQKAPGNRQVRTAAATSMLLLGDWKASIRLWNEGYHLAPDRESAQHFASTVAAAASSMETASKSNPTIEAERMSLLVKALSIAPDNPDVIEQITDILIQTRSSNSDKTELLRSHC